MKTIAERFRDALEKALKSPGEKARVARRIGIPQPLLSKYLSGKSVPGLEMAERIALRGLGLTLFELIGDIPSKPPMEHSIEECVKRVSHRALEPNPLRGLDPARVQKLLAAKTEAEFFETLGMPAPKIPKKNPG